MKKKGAKEIVTAALIAAIYAALTLGMPVISYGAFQIRIAEALTILPVFSAAAVPGLAIGCFVANIFGPYTWVDALFGTAATLIAAVLTRLLSKFLVKGFPVLSLLPPVIINAVIIGLEISLFFSGNGFTLELFIVTSLWIALGEAVSCFVLSPMIYFSVKKTELKRFLN